MYYGVWQGGAIYINDARIKISFSEFQNNHATSVMGPGGAVMKAVMILMANGVYHYNETAEKFSLALSCC